MNDLGDRVKAARKARGYPQIKLAKRAGLCSKTIIDIEHGHTEPTALTVAYIAGALRTSMDELSGREPTIPRDGEVPKGRTPGRRMRAARKHAGIGLHKLGKMTGLSTNPLHLFETDCGGMRLENIIKVADALHISLDWLWDIKIEGCDPDDDY